MLSRCSPRTDASVASCFLDKSSNSSSGNRALIDLAVVQFPTATPFRCLSIAWPHSFCFPLPPSLCSFWSGLCCVFISPWCLSLGVTPLGKPSVKSPHVSALAACSVLMGCALPSGPLPSACWTSALCSPSHQCPVTAILLYCCLLMFQKFRIFNDYLLIYLLS